MDEVAKTGIAISHAFAAVSIAAAFPTNVVALGFAALVAYLLVFY